MRLITKITVLLAFILSGCSGSPSSGSATLAVEDATSIVARGDGTFSVQCRDGRQEIATADDIRANRICSSGPTGPTELICVARDNDNAAPWVLARFTDTGAIIKIQGVSFRTLTSCQQTLRDGIFVGWTTYICIARDNDDAAPWIRASITNGAVTRQTSTSYSTYDQCRQATGGGRVFGNVSVSCAARDNDNAAPWIFVLLSERGEQRVSGPSFSSLQSCTNTVSRGRVTSSSLLLCVARDNDNAAPWIIGSLNTNGAYTPNTGTTFSSQEDCQSRLGM